MAMSVRESSRATTRLITSGLNTAALNAIAVALTARHDARDGKHGKPVRSLERRADGGIRI